MSPLGAAFTIILSLLVFVMPRRGAAVAIIATVCYITQGQEVFIGFHFTAIRLVLLAALIRVIARGELRQLHPNVIDQTLIAYAICIFVISTLRVGSSDELTYQVGVLYNVILSYFTFRCLLKGEDDVRAVLAMFGLVVIPFALLIAGEARSGTNPFAIFGGVSGFSLVRDGSVRAQGAFRSPITAGAFGATLAMLYAGMLFARANRRLAMMGLAASIMIVICAHSSGPLLGFALGMLALAMWRLRAYTRTIRWSIVTALIGLHLVMKAPVWFLLGRVSDIAGGGGYHRSYLIDRFVNSFSSWWLAGTSDTGDWMVTQLSSGGADLTNQFVADGVNAGLVGLAISIMVISRCFQRLGLSMKAVRSFSADTERLLWGLGATLVCSIGILFSVTYFDQMQVVWYMLLASIAAITSEAMPGVPEAPAALAVAAKRESPPLL